MVAGMVKKIDAGGEVDRAEALKLYLDGDLLVLGKLANRIRKRLHPQDRVTFVVDRNVNYTNVCESKCRFCAFYRDAQAPDAYLLGKTRFSPRSRNWSRRRDPAAHAGRTPSRAST